MEWGNKWLEEKEKEKLDQRHESTRRSRLKHPETFKKWRAKNPERGKAYTKKYAASNRERTRKWRKDNPEQDKRLHEKWRKDNPEYNKEWLQSDKGKAVRQRGRVKRQIRLHNVINTLTAQEWIDKLIEYDFRCAYCGAVFDADTVPTRDHIIPISKGGHNTKDNVVPACQSCNSKKGTKEYYQGIKNKV